MHGSHFHEASLEVLTDGSELTEPAIFLTIRRCNSRARRHGHDGAEGGKDPNRRSLRYLSIGVPEIFYEHAQSVDSESGNDAGEGTIVARYNLTGLPSLTGRLSSDQSFRLLQGGAFRAVLIPSLITSFHDGRWGTRGGSMIGLPALFLSLIKSGYKVAQPSMPVGGSDRSDSAPENEDGMPGKDLPRRIGGYATVSIIGPPKVGATVDGMLDTMFGNVRRRPSIRTCEIPAARNWWEVYRDSHVRIWAQAVPHRPFRVFERESCGASAKTNGGANEELSSEDSSDEDSDGSSESGSSREVEDGSAESSLHATDSEYSIVYIVMLLPDNEVEVRFTKERGKDDIHTHCRNLSYSFAIMPKNPSLCGVGFSSTKRYRDSAPFWNVLRNLPQDIVSSKQKCNPLLDFILHLDPTIDGVEKFTGKNDTNIDKSKGSEPLGKRRRTESARNGAGSLRKKVKSYGILVPSWAIDSELASHHLATFPNCHRDDFEDSPSAALDKGLLIRARNRSQLLHDFLPFAFPLSINNADRHSSLLNQKHQQQMFNAHKMDGDGSDTLNAKKNAYSSAIANGLRSCTSVVLHGWNIDRDEIKARQPFTFVSRIESINDRCKGRAHDREALLTAHFKYTQTVQSLKRAFSGDKCLSGECMQPPSSVATGFMLNDNEIDLDSCPSGNDDSQVDTATGSMVDDNEIDLDSFPSVSDDSQVNAGHNSSQCSNACAAEGTMPQHKGGIDVASPHLIILGTGCATPSPLRGSSAYGLFLPASLDDTETLVLSALIECGEGTLTGLLRHLPPLNHEYGATHSHLDVQLSSVSFIWISHSHLDHYGDLPIVVQAIANAKRKFRHSTEQQRQQTHPVLVIAPSKVLKYLNIVIYRPSGSRKRRAEDSQQPLYIGITHREFQHSPFARHLRALVYDYTLPIQKNPSVQKQIKGAKHYHPFASLHNVEVEHCREAFALLLWLNLSPKAKRSGGMRSNDSAGFVLCFSGDTRPSAQLVRQCSPSQSCVPSWQQTKYHRHIIPQAPLRAVSLLLHEATFLNDARGRNDAARKRHSTTAEALDVARRMNAEACLLTHFSQRYKHVSIEDICAGESSYPFCWGVALDGMMVPLTKCALSSLFELSQCVDTVMSLNSEE